MKKFLLFLCVAATMFAAESATAQISLGQGQLSGALESNNIYYGGDKRLEEFGKLQRPDGNFGSHDFIKLDYTLGRFSAGIQIDGYLPPLMGYDMYTYYQRRDQKSNLLAFLTKYVQWEDANYGVRVGDIFDQFGNGLVFRTYEDRALGFNNSLAGARVFYNFNNYVSIKALAGLPRLYDVRSTNWVYGADLSVSISDIAGWQNGLISVEGSYVGRYQKGNAEQFALLGIDSDYLNMVSGRLNFEYAGFSLHGEYATKLNVDMYNKLYAPSKGNVIHLDFGYNYRRFSIAGTFRRYQGMHTMIEVPTQAMGLGGGNFINFLPQLTRQYTYMLANLNPYSGAASGGEIGGQVDVFYSLRSTSNRVKYWNFHLNFSMFNTLDHLYSGIENKGRNVWMDINFDVERQWSRKFKTTFLYSCQKWDEHERHGDDFEPYNCVSHIMVADITYKINRKHSLRFEAQYLASSDFEGDWVAALVEYNIAPKFSVYVSDMWNWEAMDDNYNYDINKHQLLHYYQIGASYTHGRIRAQLSYGRNREGYVCSGGACRYQPAYTGFNLAITASF